MKVLTVILLILSFTVGVWANPVDRGKATMALRSSVVLVHELSKLQTPFCGGTLIALDRVLTAAHCVRKLPTVAYKAKVWGSDGGLKASVEKISIGRDLAVLKLDKSSEGRVAPLSTDVGVFDPLVIVGAPDTEEFLVVLGRIAKIVKDSFENCQKDDQLGWTEQQLLLIDATGWFGSSGGGVFDESGNIVGVIVRGNITGDSCKPGEVSGTALWMFGVGPEAIKAFLSEKGDEPSTP